MVLDHLGDGIKQVVFCQVIQPFCIDINEIMPYSPIHFAGNTTHTFYFSLLATGVTLTYNEGGEDVVIAICVYVGNFRPPMKKKKNFPLYLL